MRWRLYDARAWDPPVEGRYEQAWRRAVLDGGPTDVPTTSARLTAAAVPAFRLLSVTDVAQDPEDPPVRRPALLPSRDGDDLRVYATPARCREPASLTPSASCREDAQLAAVLDAAFDGRRMGRHRRAAAGAGDAPAGGLPGRARIVRYEPERVVEATARRPSELVLTDLHYPG